MNATTGPVCNTSAVASIDGEDLATIHASDMADVLGGYTRSVALVIDRADLHWLRRVLEAALEDRSVGKVDKYDAKAAQGIVDAITETLDVHGLR